MKRSLIVTTSVACSICASSAGAAIISYSHDAAGRLTAVNYGGTSSTAYAYDRNGNLLSRTDRVNPFLPLLGTYTGLVKGATPSAINSGIISLTVASKGIGENPFAAQFTGTLKLGGSTYKLRGTFDAIGAATVQIERKGGLAAITLNLHLDLETGELTGTLSGGEAATLSATLTPYNKKTPPPTGLVGAYTALFEPTQAGATIPRGTGLASFTVSTAGSVKVVGTLADGSKLSLGTTLAGNGSSPIFIPLYKNHGFIAGEAAFGTIPGESDFAGILAWEKFLSTTGLVYPAPFSTEVNLVGSKYLRPGKNQRVLDLADGDSNARVTTDGGNSAALDKLVTLDMRNKISVVAPGGDKLKLSISISSGLVGGSFVDGTSTRKLQAIIFQEQNRAAGFFLGTTESGIFELTEP